MPDHTPDQSPARVAELERKLAQAEDALRRSEAGRQESQDYFGRSFHASPALMAIVRVQDGKILESNDAFLRASGYTRDEVLGRTAIELGIWPKPEMRATLMEQILRTGSVRNFETIFHTKNREARYVLLSVDVFDQAGMPCMLITAMDFSERRRREQLQEATFEISRVLLAGGDLNALFAEVHRIIGGLMPARNFYVALLNPDDGMIHFPYFQDEVVESAPPRKPANGLTEHVLQTGQTVLATPPELHTLLSQHGSYTPLERPAAVRLAAPLLIGNKAIGVIAVQDYSDPQAYGEEAKRLLLFVADQAAATVHRRLSEIRQRESQDFLSKSFDTTPAVMIIARFSDGHILEANAGFEQASGYTRAEAVGRNTLDLGLWSVASQRDQFLETLQRDGHVRDFEGIFRTKQGSMRYLILNADAFEMRGTKCMLTVGVDITERRRREQVQEATYQISQAVLAGSDLMTLFAEVHRIIAGLMSARNFYVALLSTDGSLLSFPYFVDETIAPPASRKPGFGLTEYVLHTSRPLLTTADELTVIRKEHSRYVPLGKPAALWLGVPLIIDGRAIGVIAVQDYRNNQAYDEEDKRLLTFVAGQTAVAVQRRQTDAALQRAEEQYRGIFENALEGLYITSADGRFLRANPAMARILGYTAPADLIKAVNDIGLQIYANGNRRAEFMELIRHSNEVTDFESEVVRPDGSRLWISESVRVTRNAAGEVQHLEGVAIDVTAQHEAARVLREAKEAADTANRAKSQFLASMSHELRTPLNGILGYTQILRRDAALNDRQRSGVAVIHQSADHLLALINDVLDLAKIEAHKLELHPAEFDLPEFAQSVAEFFAPRAREKNLLLETSFSPGLPRVVVGDAQRLRQVIFNLISNAIKFTAQGGVVFSVERPGEMVRFSVSDSGPGISSEDQSRLFEPFAQLGDQSQRVGGTGLGLNVSRSILEQMGSRLMVESQTGWGTRFWFELALPEAMGASLKSRPPARRITGYLGPRQRVLVADDHAPNRAVLVDLLEPIGFDVETANDGQQAIDCAREEKPDLVFLDLRMPKVDGLAAALAIRDMFPDDPPCLIGISASAHEAQRQAALAAGCVAFLAKPFRDEDLFGLVERHLGLVWRYSDPLPSTESAVPFPVLSCPPSPAAAAAIFDLACKGDVMGVRNYAQQLAAKDARLAPFAQNIIDLAGRFKMKAIRSFVARYRDPEPSATPPPES